MKTLQMWSRFLLAGLVAGLAPTRSPAGATSSTALMPVVQETGRVSLSIDGLGTAVSTGTIQVQKPPGATVRGAYLAAASIGFRERVLVDGDVSINGTPVNFSRATPSSIRSSNHFADVTAIVKPVVDAAEPGLVSLTIGEVTSSTIDGEVLAVIFDDPGQTTENTVALLFGAQAIAGDTFTLSFASALNPNDRNLVLDLSLGISFGAQPSSGEPQFSLIDVNGRRLTSSAGGQDDQDTSGGGLLTVGGIGDRNDNPPPNASPTTRDTDDELYNLKPFVTAGARSLDVFTRNPSNDDNIFFGAFFLKGATAVVGEGILLAPATATNPVGTSHTVTASIVDGSGDPVVGREVTFTVTGPNATSGRGTTNAAGVATFTYTGRQPGTDRIRASFVDSQEQTVRSNFSSKVWVDDVARARRFTSFLASPDGRVGTTNFLVNEAGRFTGAIAFAGVGRFPMIGSLEEGGLTREVRGLGSVELGLVEENGPFLRVLVTRPSGQVSEATAVLSPFSPREPTSAAGTYTMLLPTDAEEDPTKPQGTGYAAVVIDRSGNFRAVGVLSDGTPFGTGSGIHEEGMIPFYAGLYAGRVGQIEGVLSLDSEVTGGGVSGSLTWTKPAGLGGIYPAGFVVGMNVENSRYARPGQQDEMLALNPAGEVQLEFSEGNLTELLSGGAVVPPIGPIAVASPVRALTFLKSSGFFSGFVLDPEGRSRRFRGAVLQEENRGAGFFLGADQSGEVSLVPGSGLRLSPAAK